MKTTVMSAFMFGIMFSANAQYSPSASVLTGATIHEVYAGQVIEFTVPFSSSVPGSLIAGPLISGLGLPSTIAPLIQGALGSQQVPLSITNTTLSVSGLPAGVTATCDATPCTYMAGASGYITLSGTPTVGGVFTVNINSLTNGEADLSALAAQDPTGQVPSTFALPQPAPGAVDETGYTMNVSDPNGIEESNAFFSLGLYPNPTEGISTLDVNSTVAGMATVEVYSVTGSLLQTETKAVAVGANRLKLDLSGQPVGIYMVKADINGHQALIRIQKN